MTAELYRKTELLYGKEPENNFNLQQKGMRCSFANAIALLATCLD